MEGVQRPMTRTIAKRWANEFAACLWGEEAVVEKMAAHEFADLVKGLVVEHATDESQMIKWKPTGQQEYDSNGWPVPVAKPRRRAFRKVVPVPVPRVRVREVLSSLPLETEPEWPAVRESERPGAKLRRRAFRKVTPVVVRRIRNGLPSLPLETEPKRRAVQESERSKASLLRIRLHLAAPRPRKIRVDALDSSVQPQIESKIQVRIPNRLSESRLVRPILLDSFTQTQMGSEIQSERKPTISIRRARRAHQTRVIRKVPVEELGLVRRMGSMLSKESNERHNKESLMRRGIRRILPESIAETPARLLAQRLERARRRHI